MGPAAAPGRGKEPRRGGGVALAWQAEAEGKDMEWLATHSAGLNVAMNGAMLLVWMAYLHLFLTSFRRANRAVIHIARATDTDGEARCLVTNMGSDTVYILGIKVDVHHGEERSATLVTDRVDEKDPLGGEMHHRTNQGPLCGGEVLDIGAFHRICARATGADPEEGTAPGESVEITVIVAAHQAKRLMGGYKRFDITEEEGVVTYRSEDVLTRQITSPFRRRDLRRELAA